VNLDRCTEGFVVLFALTWSRQERVVGRPALRLNIANGINGKLNQANFVASPITIGSSWWKQIVEPC
jgi:hypothetical protein